MKVTHQAGIEKVDIDETELAALEDEILNEEPDDKENEDETNDAQEDETNDKTEHEQVYMTSCFYRNCTTHI